MFHYQRCGWIKGAKRVCSKHLSESGQRGGVMWHAALQGLGDKPPPVVRYTMQKVGAMLSQWPSEESLSATNRNLAQ